MFSGIVESTQPILAVEAAPGAVRIQIQKPKEFDDLKAGDSIAVNGICLTVENLTDNQIRFTLAAETLLLLKIDASKLKGQIVNLERSLRFGDRIHGHLVSGHVDSLGWVVRSEPEGESWMLDVDVDSALAPLIWKKGGITLQGVALTVNNIVRQAERTRVSVCLIPETLRRTNLKELKAGDRINVEADYFAKAVIHNFSERNRESSVEI